MGLPRVLILGLGGTIAMTAGGEGAVPTLSAADLVAAVPALADVAAVSARSFRSKPSAHLTFADLEELADRIRSAPEFDGFVITQGTDTIEESAFALDLLLGGVAAPVVVTGAMRNPSLPGADGPANLLAAVQTAASPAARGLGVLVVMNDEIHAARFVQKAHTANTAAFTSLPRAPLGMVAEGDVRMDFTLAPLPPLPGPKQREARVALLVASLGDEGDLFRAAVASGYDGIVVEAFGGGHVTLALAEAIEAAARRIPVVVTPRPRRGPVLRATYGFPGGEIDLARRGAILGAAFDSLKARVWLRLLLERGADAQTIRAVIC